MRIFSGSNQKEKTLKRKLAENKKYFDNMFKDIDINIVLDEQQRKAILADNDNILVIAGAGSGKTTTMVAKVKYLIDKCGYKQSEIAVLSFTKKVTEELTKIIHDKFGLTEVNISTFHKLGLDIIREVEDIDGIIDDASQYTIFANYIKNELYFDKEKFNLFVSSFNKYLRFGEDCDKYSNFQEYHSSIFNNELINSGLDLKEYNKEQMNRRRQYRRTIKGEYLDSKEEVDIANYLYLHGIQYEHGKKYNGSKKLLRPDFFISQLENNHYIEHFGVDQNGQNNMYTKDNLKSYLKNMAIKKEFYNQEFNINLFIITYSKYDNGQTYLSDLKQQLIDKGYQFFHPKEEEVYNTLLETSQDRYMNKFIDKIIIPFIDLFKQRGFDNDTFDELISEQDGLVKNQLIVMKDFYVNYERTLAEKKKIDFNDMIAKAYNIMPMLKEKNLGVDYKYLIIDEYQDISNQRFNLVDRMAKLFDAKIMAVGDDWQAIFGYSGADIELFRSFNKCLKNTEIIPIENTYRCSQELIDIAGEFVSKNKYQIKKSLHSKKHLNNPVELIVYDDSDFFKSDINRAQIVDQIINHIYSRYPRNKILLLGRYQRDINNIQDEQLFSIRGEKVKSKRNPRAILDFLTIHKAKGLGYDNCILLNLNDDRYGFPSKIENEPIVKLIKPKSDESIEYAEERRLFYVALTRTKNKIYILVPKSKESIFAREIELYENVKKQYTR